MKNEIWNDIKIVSDDKENVKKFVFTKQDVAVESVLYKYPTYSERTVICCSTQGGCNVGCRFCGTGDYFVRSLTADEIVSQSVYILEQIDCAPNDIEKLQIMFMSMGEPMLNYENLELAIKSLNENTPNAKLLVSTSAPVVPATFEKFNKLSKDIENIGLQFSVHESTDEARKQLIPTKTSKLSEIAQYGERWFEETKRKPFFNYCVHENNNTKEDVDRLFELFNPCIWEATISVICERDENVAAANDRQKQLASDFMDKMIKAGYSTRMFNPAGQDSIGGGCGMLWYVQDWYAKNPDKIKKSRGFGLPKLHTPR